MWSVGGDFGAEHNSSREMAHQYANRGYVKSTSSLALSPEDEAFVQEQLDERSAAKRDREFQTADDIRENLLQQYDVSINDKEKLWSAGGAFAETGRNEARGVYKRRGGGNLSDEVVQEIQDALMERYHHKKDRNFDEADAIRSDLEDRFDVRVDDRSGEWRIETDEYFPASTADLSAGDIELIADKLRQRFMCKRDREYDTADAIRDELRDRFGVVVDDRTKEWTVEAVERPQHSVRYDEEEVAQDDSQAVSTDLDDSEDEEEDEDEITIASASETEDVEEDDESTEDGEDSVLLEEELLKLTVVVLKEKLRDVGLPVSGKKAELVARLLTEA